MVLFKENTDNKISSWQIFTMSAIVSAVLLFVCSKNSLIYPMNDYIDVNIFFSVTDSLFHGNVLYKDIFEHKGPFLYLIYAFIHILGNSYFTLYLFECVANALFICFGTKTILLYDEKASKFRVFLYALCLEFCLCTAASFMFGGVPEELLLWMSSYGLYTTLRCLKHKLYYANKELVLMGLMCGALFWTKYALLGLYSGLALYVIGWNLAQKEFARLGKTSALFLSGFAIASLPTVIYCSLTHSISDMVNVYFIGNILGEHVTPNAMAHYYGLMNVVYKDIAIILLIAIGTIYTIKSEQKDTKLLYLITLLPTFLGSCCLKVFFPYYPLPMLLFLPFGIVAWREMKIRREFKFGIAAFIILLHLFASVEYGMYDLVIGDKINPLWLKEHFRVLAKAVIPLLLLHFALTIHKNLKSKNEAFIWCLCVLAICTIVGFGIRDPDYFTTEQEFPQIRFKEAISKIDNANILVYGCHDYGFFKNNQTYPQVKYFCDLNLVADERESKQMEYIKNEIIDYIITFKEPDDMKKIIINTSYELIDTSEPYSIYGYTKVFYLYKKHKELL